MLRVFVFLCLLHTYEARGLRRKANVNSQQSLGLDEKQHAHMRILVPDWLKAVSLKDFQKKFFLETEVSTWKPLEKAELHPSRIIMYLRTLVHRTPVEQIEKLQLVGDEALFGWIKHLKDVAAANRVKPPKPSQTAVVGLGPAGLAAAIRLVDENVPFYAYERRDKYDREYPIDLLNQKVKDFTRPGDATWKARQLRHTIDYCDPMGAIYPDTIHRTKDLRMRMCDLEQFLSLCLHILANDVSYVNIRYNTEIMKLADLPTPVQVIIDSSGLDVGMLGDPTEENGETPEFPCASTEETKTNLKFLLLQQENIPDAKWNRQPRYLKNMYKLKKKYVLDNKRGVVSLPDAVSYVMIVTIKDRENPNPAASAITNVKDKDIHVPVIKYGKTVDLTFYTKFDTQHNHYTSGNGWTFEVVVRVSREFGEFPYDEPPGQGFLTWFLSLTDMDFPENSDTTERLKKVILALARKKVAINRPEIHIDAWKQDQRLCPSASAKTKTGKKVFYVGASLVSSYSMYGLNMGFAGISGDAAALAISRSVGMDTIMYQNYIMPVALRMFVSVYDKTFDILQQEADKNKRAGDPNKTEEEEREKNMEEELRVNQQVNNRLQLTHAQRLGEQNAASNPALLAQGMMQNGMMHNSMANNVNGMANNGMMNNGMMHNGMMHNGMMHNGMMHNGPLAHGMMNSMNMPGGQSSGMLNSMNLPAGGSMPGHPMPAGGIMPGHPMPAGGSMPGHPMPAGGSMPGHPMPAGGNLHKFSSGSTNLGKPGTGASSSTKPKANPGDKASFSSSMNQKSAEPAPAPDGAAGAAPPKEH